MQSAGCRIPKTPALARSWFFHALFCLTVLLSSCASVQVSQDYDAHYRFGNANSFGWNETLQRDNDRLVVRDELLAKRFRTAINHVLADRGFTQDAHPAYLISYIYTVTSRFQVDPAYSSFGFGHGYGWHRFHHGAEFYSGDYIRQYDQGELIISIHSALTGQLLWKGTGTREVYVHSTPERITESVNEMVEAVLAQFPPAG